VDPADVGGHVEPDKREPGHRRFQSRVDAASVVGDLNVSAAGDDDRNASPSGVDVQVDDVVVELGFGEVDPHAAQVGADVCLPGDLPSPARRSRPVPEWISRGRASRRSGLVKAMVGGSDRTTSASSASVLAASIPSTQVSKRPPSMSPAA
jgi:hypothetical protein